MNLNLTVTEIIHGRVKRTRRIQEAIAWPGGTMEEKMGNTIWSKNDSLVSLNKPGKEAAVDYNRCKYTDGSSGNNPNDMLPILTTAGNHSKNISFAEVFRDLFVFMGNVRQGEIFGAILVRMAYLADHKLDETGTFWRYQIPQDALEQIKEQIPMMYDVTVESFLHYMDALAWNEDVKYHTLGYDPNKGYGGMNNLLTYANIVAAAIEKIDLYSVVGSFARPPVGVSPISRSKAYEVFPDLGEYERLPGRNRQRIILEEITG